MKPNDMPQEPQLWPFRGGFERNNDPAPVEPQPQNRQEQNPPNVNNAWANRPIVWIRRPFAAAQAHRQGRNRISKLALVIIGVILFAFILNKVSQPKMNLNRYGSTVSPTSEPTKNTNLNPADRLIRAIDNFLGK